MEDRHNLLEGHPKLTKLATALFENVLIAPRVCLHGKPVVCLLSNLLVLSDLIVNDRDICALFSLREAEFFLLFGALPKDGDEMGYFLFILSELSLMNPTFGTDFVPPLKDMILKDEYPALHPQLLEVLNVCLLVLT